MARSLSKLLQGVAAALRRPDQLPAAAEGLPSRLAALQHATANCSTATTGGAAATAAAASSSSCRGLAGVRWYAHCSRALMVPGSSRAAAGAAGGGGAAAGSTAAAARSSTLQHPAGAWRPWWVQQQQQQQQVRARTTSAHLKPRFAGCKIKPYSSYRRRFKMTGTGKVMFPRAGHVHKRFNKSKRQLFALSGTKIMTEAYAKVVRKLAFKMRSY